jgi:hypothetical protein
LPEEDLAVHRKFKRFLTTIGTIKNEKPTDLSDNSRIWSSRIRHRAGILRSRGRIIIWPFLLLWAFDKGAFSPMRLAQLAGRRDLNLTGNLSCAAEVARPVLSGFVVTRSRSRSWSWSWSWSELCDGRLLWRRRQFNIDAVRGS